MKGRKRTTLSGSERRNLEAQDSGLSLVNRSTNIIVVVVDVVVGVVVVVVVGVVVVVPVAVVPVVVVPVAVVPVVVVPVAVVPVAAVPVAVVVVQMSFIAHERFVNFFLVVVVLHSRPKLKA